MKKINTKLEYSCKITRTEIESAQCDSSMPIRTLGNNRRSYLHKYYFHDELDLSHEWRLGQELEETASPLERKWELKTAKSKRSITHASIYREVVGEPLLLDTIAQRCLSYNEEDEGDHLMH